MGWQAIDHWLGDGDYYGFNLSRYREAIAEYEKAWGLLVTPWQRKTMGTFILEGIADFALRSGDPELVGEILERLRRDSDGIPAAPLREACEKLSRIAGQPNQG